MPSGGGGGGISAVAMSAAHLVEKGWGSFHTPSVEVLIRQTDADNTPPQRPPFVTAFDLPREIINGQQQQDKSNSDAKAEQQQERSIDAQLNGVSLGAVSPFGRNLLSRLFFIDGAWTFLNHGAFGATLKPLLHIRNDWSAYAERQPLRFYDRELLPLLVDTIRRLAKFVGAPPTSVTLHTNATTALNVLFRSLSLPPGSKILRLNLCYGSVKKMIDSLTDVEVVELAVPLPLRSPADLVSLVSRALDEHGDSIKLAVFDHVASNSAILHPIGDLVRVCHARGVRVLVDGAHALGSVPHLQLESSRVDYFVSNAHKWLCNPKGAAMLYVAPQHQPHIRPLVVSHGSGAGYTSNFIWTGTGDYSSLLTLSSTLDLWEQVGLERAMRYSHDLVLRAGRYLADRWGTELLVGGGDVAGEEQLTANMLCVRLPGPLDPADSDEHNVLQDRLHYQYAIEVPIKVLGQPPRLYVRLSAFIYNEMDDYVRLGEAMLNLRCGSSARVSAPAVPSFSPLPLPPPAAEYFSSLPKASVEAKLLRADHTQVCIPPGAEDRAREFYIGLLGLVEVPRPNELSTRGGLWLYAGPETDPRKMHANVHIGSESLPHDHYAKTRAHIAYSVRNLRAWVEKLRAAGYDTIPGVKVQGMERFDTRDPFGNKVTLAKPDVELIEYDVDPILGCSAPAVAAREKSNGRSVSGSATVSAESRRAQEYFWHTPRAYENKPLLRVGVYQDSTDPGDFAANLRRIHSALLKAKAEGVELLLFGELFLSGYAISERETWHRLAMGQDSPQLSQIREWCKEMRIAVCIGYPELLISTPDKVANHHSDGCSCCQPTEKREIFNSAMIIGDDGRTLLNYRKTHLWEVVEKSVFTAGPEDALRVCNYRGVRVGINICYDIELPECSRVLALDGCQLLLVPTALAKGIKHELVPTKVVNCRAIDNHMWVAYANHVGPSYKDKDFCGLSAIVGPDGVDLTRASEDEEGRLLVHDLNPATFASEFETTPMLVDRRPELFDKIAEHNEWK